jgi:hypothetical protein
MNRYVIMLHGITIISLPVITALPDKSGRWVSIQERGKEKKKTHRPERKRGRGRRQGQSVGERETNKNFIERPTTLPLG